MTTAPLPERADGRGGQHSHNRRAVRVANDKAGTYEQVLVLLMRSNPQLFAQLSVLAARPVHRTAQYLKLNAEPVTRQYSPSALQSVAPDPRGPGYTLVQVVVELLSHRP